MEDEAVPLIGYITVPTSEAALTLGRILVEEKLAGCIHVLPGMTSIYAWQGKIETSAECLLLAKTSATRKDALLARVKAWHPYELPCILFLPITGGHAPYLSWLMQGCRP